MASQSWIGFAMGVVGLAFILNVRGCSAGMADLARHLKGDKPSFTTANMPASTWGWRLFGAVVLVFGALVAISPPPS